MEKIKNALKELYDIEYGFTPFAIQYYKTRGSSFVGYMEIRIFGIRIAYIQQTKPWEKL